MPLGSTTFWGIVIPVGDRTNLLANPSGERGTAGWGTWIGGTVGTTSQFQQFGAWSGSVAPSSNGTAGILLGSLTLGAGTSYGVSCYVRGANGIPYNLLISDNSGDNHQGSQTFTGGGTWQRISFTYLEQFGGPRKMTVRKQNSANTDAFYVDGAQLEVGSVTTVIDGDQEGCYWLGEPHNSQSVRSGTYRGGGSVMALADLGLRPDEHMGIGMSPQEVIGQSYALQAGAEYQNSRAGERPFTLTFQPVLGTTTRDFHVTRRKIINAIKPDLLDPQQPVRFWYIGGEGTVQIDAVYASGLELGEMNGPMAENGAVKFVAHDPAFYSTTQQGTALAPRVALGSTNYMAKRDPYGRWGTLGANGSVTDLTINALAYYNGTIHMGGIFGSVAGTRSGALAFYNTQSGGFGTFGGTVQANGIEAITISPDGTVIFGGAFTNISGLSNTRFIAGYGAGFATITGGTTNAAVTSFAWRGGTLGIGGAFSGVAGTTTGGFALWRRAGYGSTTGGTFNAEVRGVGVGLDGRFYVTTNNNSASPGGTAINYVAQWNGAWGSLGLGFQGGGNAGAQPVAVGPNGFVYFGGGYGSAGGGSAQNVSYWNGVQHFPMSYGLGIFNPGVNEMSGMFADQKTGDVYAWGPAADRSGARTFPDQVSKWNGYIWLPLDVDFQTSDVKAVVQTPDQSLYVAGAFNGTAFCAGVAQIMNAGMADAYPTVKLRNTSGATIRLYQLGNTYTGDMLYFDLMFEPGEELTLETEPGFRSFTSNFAGNVFGRILPGSDIAGFRLAPALNYISLFCDSGSVAASIYWNARSDAIDGGTIF